MASSGSSSTPDQAAPRLVPTGRGPLGFELQRHALILVIASGSGLVLVAMVILASQAPELLAAYGTATALATVASLLIVDRGAQMQITPYTALRPFLLRRASVGPLLIVITLLYAIATQISVPMSALAAFVVAATTLRDIAMLRLASTSPNTLLLSALIKSVLTGVLGALWLLNEDTTDMAIAALVLSPVVDLALTGIVVARPRDLPGDGPAAAIPPSGNEYTFAPAAGAALINVDLLLAPHFLDVTSAALYVFWNRISAAIQLPADATSRRVLARTLPTDTSYLRLSVGIGVATGLTLAAVTLITGYDLGSEEVAAIAFLSCAAALRCGNAVGGAVLSRTDRQRQRFAALLTALIAAILLSGSLLAIAGLVGAALARLGAEAVLGTRYRRALR